MLKLYKDFTKPELIAICIELDVSYNTTDTSRTLVGLILDNLDNEGLPDDDDMSDPLWDFVDMAGYNDEEAEEVDEEVDEVEEDEEDDNDGAGVIEGEEPHCFSFAYERDPACGKCPVYDACNAERIAIRTNDMQCFGIMYSPTDENCSTCIEAGPCRAVMTTSQ